MPQLLHFWKQGLNDGSMDWETIAVYTCTAACSPPPYRPPAQDAALCGGGSDAAGSGGDSGRADNDAAANAGQACAYVEEHAWVQLDNPLPSR